MTGRCDLREEIERLASLYQLLARLLLGPIDQDLVTRLLTLPLLEGLLRESFPEADTVEALTERLAVDSYRIFGLQVFPFAGCFSTQDDWLGTSTAHQVALKYESCGFHVPTLDSERPDHIGHELLFLSFLLTKELQGENSPSFRAEQRDFLEQHILTWCVPLAIAMSQQHSYFFDQIAKLLQATLIFHRETIPEGAPNIPPNLGDAPPRDTEKFLAHSKTGLNEIADHLLRPSSAGIYLNLGFIAEIVQRCDVPAGFGDRRSLLRELFSSGAQFEKMGEVLDALLQFVDLWHDRLLDQPQSLGPYYRSWLSNNRNTRNLLETIQGKIAR
jgi:TorA maturation chaperone TorD